MIENSQLLELVGKTKTQKLLDEITSEFQETFMKKYPDYSEFYPTKANSIVTVVKDNEIKKIGMSCMNDLFSAQFGIMLGLIFTDQGDSNIKPRNFIINENFIPSGSFNIQGDQFNNTASATDTGGVTRIGAGTTPPTRADIQLESERQFAENANAGYNSGLGKISCPAQYANVQTYDLSETGLFFQCRVISPVVENANILVSHDAISPVVPVDNGETINVDYSLLI